jgi:hypothetical protein
MKVKLNIFKKLRKKNYLKKQKFSWSKFSICISTLVFFFPLHAQTFLPDQKALTSNLLSQAARQIGISQCLKAIDRLAGLAVDKSLKHDLIVDWDRRQPDKGPFFSLIGIEYLGTAAAATIAVVPDGSESCTVAAERISVAPYTCESVGRVELSDHKRTTLLPTMNVYTLSTDMGSSVTLIDSPPGCLIIRRLVQYNWKPNNN